jgi:spore coat protein CotF
MNNDYLDPINSLNMPEIADTSFAMDFMTRAKNGVRNYAIALTETASAEARALLRTQLHEAIALHDEAAKLMMAKKWFHPYELSEQFRLDNITTQNTVQIAEMDLFPADTSRKGMFDRKPDQSREEHTI